MLDRATVDHVAELAKLGLTPEERWTYCQQLSQIVDYVNQLASLDTSGVVEAARPGPGDLRLRPDEVRPSLDRSVAIANAPETTHGQFRVPALLERGSADRAPSSS